jgi:hypothetical protein
VHAVPAANTLGKNQSVQRGNQRFIIETRFDRCSDVFPANVRAIPDFQINPIAVRTAHASCAKDPPRMIVLAEARAGHFYRRKFCEVQISKVNCRQRHGEPLLGFSTNDVASVTMVSKL